MFSREEYDAAHHTAVISDGLSRGTILLTGSDRNTFLHGLLTQDIAGLAPETGAYAAYLTPQGRMISDMRVLNTGDRTLLGVERGVAAPLAARLESLIFSEDAQAKDVTGEMDEVRVHGPAAAAIIERALGASTQRLIDQYANLTVDRLAIAMNNAGLSIASDNARVTIVRDDAFGVPGFDVYVSSQDASVVRDLLRGAGAIGAGIDTLETLRIEAGRPLFGVDMDTDTIPLEAGIEKRAISFTKGCYVGQEVIIRVMHRGHGRVARRLVRLALRGGVPQRGDKVLAGDQHVGHITSATDSPEAASPLAFAYVHRDFAAGGSSLSVNGSSAVVYERLNQ